MKETQNKLYIAYGSNMNIEQMCKRCPDAYIVGKSAIDNYELLFRGTRNHSGVATIEPKLNSSVPVLVWNISNLDEIFLDRYEGYPYLYTKKEVQIKLAGKKVTAMIYIMNDGHDLGLPSRYYEKIIRDSYKSIGFSELTLDLAIANSKY